MEIRRAHACNFISEEYRGWDRGALCGMYLMDGRMNCTMVELEGTYLTMVYE